MDCVSGVGLNEWCLNEGLAQEMDNHEVSEALADKYGLSLYGNEQWIKNNSSPFAINIKRIEWLHNVCDALIPSSDLSSDLNGEENELEERVWDYLYDTVFNEAFHNVVDSIVGIVEWADPDTSCKQDIIAYLEAIQERCDELLDLVHRDSHCRD